MTNTVRSQALRKTIEAELAGSFAGALTPKTRTARPVLSFGIEELDRATGGGAPLGALTEIVGLGSTGKTGIAMQVAAGAMHAGKVCAWVDASDSFDPRSAQDNGMLLPQLLWVRCGGEAEAIHQAEAASVLRSDAGQYSAAGVNTGRCGSHPRSEEQGLNKAVGGLFQALQPEQALRDEQGAPFPLVRAGSYGSNRVPPPAADWPDGSRTGMHSTRNRQTIGTPGAPNVPLSPYKRAPHTPHPAFRPVPRSEQVASDRLGGRKLAHAGESERKAPAPPLGKEVSRSSGKEFGSRVERPSGRPWSRLDQALRAADLLLQAGGFSLLVLDFGSIAPEHVLRVPAATWFRFRAVAEANGTACVLLSQAPCARSSASLVLTCKPIEIRHAGGTVMESMRYQAEVARLRFQAETDPRVPRKQPLATWQSSHYELSQIAEKESAEPRSSHVLAWKTPTSRP